MRLRTANTLRDQGPTVRPKSEAGRRVVLVPPALRKYLAEHELRSTWKDGLAFGQTPTQPWRPDTINERAANAWKTAETEARETDPEASFARIGLHECRHPFASLTIAACVNAKALSTYIGHSSITITLDRYSHLMPGNENEAARLLDSYLDAATVVRS
jgi:integrase